MIDKHKLWADRVRLLKKGLTLKQISKILTGVPYSSLRFWLIECGYKFKDGRSYAWDAKRKENVTRVQLLNLDFTKSNIELSKEHNCTREYIRQLREQAGAPKVGRKRKGKK